MTHVLHRAQLELLLHPLDVVLVVEEQGHLLRGERELEPTLGVGTGDLPIHKGRTGAQGQEQGRLTAHQATGGKQLIRIREPQIDVHTRRDDPGAVGGLDIGVVRVLRVRALEALAIPRAQGAARQQGEAALGQPGPEATAGLQEQVQLGGVAGRRWSDVFEIAAIRLGDEALQGRRHLSGAADNGSIRAARVELHLKALEQQGGAHARQARAFSMPRALFRVS